MLKENTCVQPRQARDKLAHLRYVERYNLSSQLNSYPRKCGRSVKLTTYQHPIPKLEMHGAVPPLPHTSSGDPLNYVQGQRDISLWTSQLKAQSTN